MFNRLTILPIIISLAALIGAGYFLINRDVPRFEQAPSSFSGQVPAATNLQIAETPTIRGVKHETLNSNTEPGKEIDQKTSPAPQIRSVSVLGWIPYWDQRRAFKSFTENVELFDFLALFWYRIDSSGSLTTYNATIEDTSIIDVAHENGIAVLAVIANLSDYNDGGDWDYHRVEHVINSADARASHITDILELVHKYDFDGINIDYEALRRSQRDDFTLFIQELSEALHADDKLLAVAIHPKTSENNPAEDNGSHAQDWEQIIDYVDQFQFMTYGEHYGESQPGPIASPTWMEAILNYAVNSVGVSPKKIFLGIPFYAEEWRERSSGSFVGSARDLTFLDTQSVANQYNVPSMWDDASQSPHLNYVKGRTNYVVWYEDSQSVRAKVLLLEKFGIHNIAIWRLGGEDPDNWLVLREFAGL